MRRRFVLSGAAIFTVVCSLGTPSFATDIEDPIAGRISQGLSFSESFETDLWAWLVTGQEALALDPVAKAIGDLGLAVGLDLGGESFIVNHNPWAESHAHVAFFFHPGSAEWDGSEPLILVEGVDSALGGVFQLQLTRADDALQWRLTAVDDHGVTQTSEVAPGVVAEDWQHVHLEWWGSDEVNRSAGGAVLRVDGRRIAELRNIDNDGQVLEAFQLGVIGALSSGTGELYVDEYRYWLGSDSRWLIFTDDFELTDLWGWEAIGDGVGITGKAKLQGKLGLAVDLEAAERSATRRWFPPEKRFAASFLVDFGAVGLLPNESLDITAAIAPETQASNLEIVLSVDEGGEPRLQLRVFESRRSVRESDPQVVALRKQRVHLEWFAADSRGGGAARLWSDGELLAELMGLDNRGHEMGGVRLGPSVGEATGTLYFDDLRTWSPRADLRYDAFESDTTWDDAIVVGDSSLEVSPEAALEGQSGLRLTAGSGESAAALFDASAYDDAHYHASFLLDVGPDGPEVGSSAELLAGYDAAGQKLMGLRLRSLIEGTAYLEIETIVPGKPVKSHSSMPWSDFDVPSRVHLEWLAGHDTVSNEGRMRLWIDGLLEAEISGVDNFAQRLETVAFGVIESLNSYGDEQFSMDEFKSWKGSHGLDTEFADGFESGSLSAWDSSIIDGDGELNVVSQSPIAGFHSLQVQVAQPGSAWVVESLDSAQLDLTTTFDVAVESPPQDRVVTLYRAADRSGRSVVEVEATGLMGEAWLRLVSFNSSGERLEGAWSWLAGSRALVRIDWTYSTGVSLSLDRADATSLPTWHGDIASQQLGIEAQDAGDSVVVLFDRFNTSTATYPTTAQNCRRGDCDDFDGG